MILQAVTTAIAAVHRQRLQQRRKKIILLPAHLAAPALPTEQTAVLQALEIPTAVLETIPAVHPIAVLPEIRVTAILADLEMRMVDIGILMKRPVNYIINAIRCL